MNDMNYVYFDDPLHGSILFYKIIYTEFQKPDSSYLFFLGMSPKRKGTWSLQNKIV